MKKPKKGILKNIWEGWKKFEKLPDETLGSIRNGLIFALLMDLFGVIYFLRLRSIGIFLFLLIVAFLSMVIIVERRRDNKMVDEALGPKDEDNGVFSNLQNDMSKTVEDIQKDMADTIDSIRKDFAFF